MAQNLIIPSNDHAKLEALIHLLHIYPNRQTYTVSGQNYTFGQCLSAIRAAIAGFLRQNPGLLNTIPQIANINEINNWDFAELAEFGLTIANFMSGAQAPEPSRLSLDELEALQRNLKASRQQAAQTQTAGLPKKALTAEKLSLKDMLELINRAKNHEKLTTQLQAAAVSALKQDLPADAQLPLSPDAVGRLTKQLAEQASELAVKHARAGREITKEDVDALVGELTKTAVGSLLLPDKQAKRTLAQSLEATLAGEEPDRIVQDAGARQAILLKEAPGAQQLERQIGRAFERTSQTVITAEDKAKLRLEIEDSLAQGKDYQTALIESVNKLNRLGLSKKIEITARQAQELCQTLTPVIEKYSALAESLKVYDKDLPYFEPARLSKKTQQKIDQLLPDTSPLAKQIAVDFFVKGVSPDQLGLLSQKHAGHPAVKHELFSQAQEALAILHPRAGETGLRQLPFPHPVFVFESPLALPISEIEKTRVNFLNNQLSRLGADKLSGWLKAPGLKWQASFANFALNHPKLAGFANFLSAPKEFIKTRAAGKIMGVGLKWAAEKGVKGLIGKGLQFAGAKLAGTALGSLIGGPIGTVIGYVAGHIIGKGLGFIQKNWKKLAAAAGALLGGGLMFILGGLAKLAAFLPSVGLGVGILIFPLNPIAGGLTIGMSALGLGKQIGAWLSKTSLGASIGKGIANFLGFSTTASVPTYIMAAPYAAIGAVAIGSTVTMMTLTSAFVLPPSKQIPGGLKNPGAAIDYTCDHPACKIADIIKAYAGGRLNQSSWALVEPHLRKFFSASTVYALYHSVFEIDGVDELQCVGFAKAALNETGINIPSRNAVSFLTKHPGCSEVLDNEPLETGYLAVWGGTNNNSNGHIGVITNSIGNQKVYVTAANADGQGSVDTREFSRQNITKILRCP